MVASSVALRAGGGAIVFVFGSAGVALPFLLTRVDNAAWLMYCKAFAAGVVLSLAVVHVINDCFANFAKLEPGERRP